MRVSSVSVFKLFNVGTIVVCLFVTYVLFFSVDEILRKFSYEWIVRLYRFIKNCSMVFRFCKRKTYSLELNQTKLSFDFLILTFEPCINMSGNNYYNLTHKNRTNINPTFISKKP